MLRRARAGSRRPREAGGGGERRRAAHGALAVAILAASAELAGCIGGYCQSGAIHGTQCYSSAEATGGAPPKAPMEPVRPPTETTKASATRYHFAPADAGVSPTR